MNLLFLPYKCWKNGDWYTQHIHSYNNNITKFRKEYIRYQGKNYVFVEICTYCDTCCQDSVYHLIMECPRLNDIRNKFIRKYVRKIDPEEYSKMLCINDIVFLHEFVNFIQAALSTRLPWNNFSVLNHYIIMNIFCVMGYKPKCTFNE